MSWPGWTPTAPTLPPVAPGPIQSTMLPAGINSAPSVLPPSLTQYSPEQWAQAQQQNWQQWAQWQQQYQQWHQQYGAEYQKSITAMQTAVAPAHPPLPAVATAAMAPPLPIEPKPPLPPEEPPIQPNAYMTMTMPPKPAQVGYSTAPPSILPQTQQPPIAGDPYNQSWQQNTAQKRPYTQEIHYEQSKKPNLDKGPNKWGQQTTQTQWQTGNQNFNQPPPQTQPATAPPVKATNVEELSEAEKKFDKEFAAWEAQFNKWKDQNANHPDKVQYKEYEKKWESWRNSLLERREQMRKKRVALTASKNQQANFTQPPPATVNQPVQVAPVTQDIQSTPGHVPAPNQTNYSVPPPNQNNEPLAFKNNFPPQDDSTAGFLQSTPSTSGGIPGLDLVKDEGKDLDSELKKPVIELDKEEKPPQQSGRPDLDAISKGINTILGDQKLLSMLSMVTQKPPPAPNPNQGYSQGRPSFSGPDIGPMNVPPPSTGGPYSSKPPNPQSYNDQSNQSYEDRSNQKDYYPQQEDINNFDDQTRSSFTLGPADQDQGFRNRGGPPGRFGGDKLGNFGPGNARNNFGPGNQRFGQDNYNTGANRNDRFGGPRNNPESNFGPKSQQEDNFGRSNFGSVSSEYDRFGGNRGNNRNDRFSNDNFDDNFRNERGSFGATRNDNFRGSTDQFNNRSGEFNKSDDYEDYDNEEEEDYDKYHNRFIEDDQDYQDDYENNDDYQHGNRDFPHNQRDFQSNQRGFQSNQNRDFPPPNQNRDFPPPSQNRDFPPPSQNRDFPPPSQNRDFPPLNKNRDFPPPNLNKDFPPSNLNRDFPPPNLNRDFPPPNQNRDFPPPNQNRDFPPPNQNRDFPPPNQNRDFPPPNQNRDFPPPNQNRDFPPPNQNRDFPPPNQNRDFPPPNQKRDFPPNQNKHLHHESIDDEAELLQPIVEDKIFEPTVVVDYDHKSLKKEDPPVTIEPVQMFDYFHKPLNCIPHSDRPEWLAECVKFIREFDPSVARLFDKFSERPERYPGRGNSYEENERRPYEEPNDFERERFDRNNRFERDDRYTREREDRYNRDREDRFERDQRYDRNNRFERPERDFSRDEFMDDDRNRRLRSGERDDNNYTRERRPHMDEFKTKFNRRESSDRDKNAKDRVNLKESLEDLSEDEMDWESGERTKQHVQKSRSNSPLLSNPPNPLAKEITTIEDIINPPGRFNRPPRIVIILRGPPGSGKTHLAKLIKDKEVEQGGSAPRILSLDDYFMNEQEKEVVEDGKVVKVKEMVYEYEAEMEESYRLSFIKSFKKTITDGYFPFIIVDNVNDKVKYFGEMWSFAKQNGFQVYICQMDLDPIQCTRRNIHNRTEAEIEECIAAWEPTPNHHPSIDASSFLQSNVITEVEMEVVESKPEAVEPEKGPEQSSMESTNRSKSPEPWKNTSNWRNDGNHRFQQNRGRRGFGGLTWKNRGNWRR